MNDQYAVSSLFIVVGVALLVHAPSAVPQSGTLLTHDGTISRSEVPADANVVEYDALAPDSREAFKKSLDSGEAHFDGPIPDRLSGSNTYIHYRDAYHEIGFEAVDSPGLGHVLVTFGFGILFLIAGVGAALDEWKKGADVD